MNHLRAAAFVEENLKTIFAYALSRVSNKDDAEDLTNDIVLAILQSADKLKDDKAFYGYVWGIAANTYRKFLRRKARVSFDQIKDALSDPFDLTQELLAKEEVLILRREIALLSKEYRECTIAYYYDGLSCAEVSQKLGISLEMVKYYLFKTRKILKEGISMEREFGEKSFKPAFFEFHTIFSGSFNREYRNLFSRKLPGQILLSTYYTAMSIRELVIELGVASVYLEDEVAMLEKHGLITQTPAGKYQTNLIIFTEDFVAEFHKRAKTIAVPAMKDILSSVKSKSERLRGINRFAAQLTDEQLLWGTLWPIIRQGHEQFEAVYPAHQQKDTLYDGATGTNFGTTFDDSESECGCSAFAGYIGINDRYSACAADFGILPLRNRSLMDFDRAAFTQTIDKTLSGEMRAKYLILTEAEETQLFKLLSDETSMMAALYERLFVCACEVMHNHAPKSVQEHVDRIIFQTLIFRTVGLIGYCAVKSEMLSLPDFKGPAALYIRQSA